ncbi:MAG TPA: histidine kinase [Steroidobacteraceae bacterium]|nr:histidine kinase [Steroidobacteraceae bacterium]
MNATVLTHDPAAAAHPATPRTRGSALVRYLLIATALGLAWGLTEVLTHAADILRLRSWSGALWFIALDLSTAYWVILLILGADRVEVARWPWWTPYVGAVLIGGILGQAVETALFQWLIPVRSLAEAHTPGALPVRPAIEYFGYLVYSLPAALLYAYLRRLRQQNARLRALQSAQASLRRNVVEARLQRMQSQLEPQDLFATLERIQELHAEDSGRSLRALDALIHCLRCGAARSASGASTLRRELATTRAWLDLRRELRNGAPSLEVIIEGIAGDAVLPAMILRPLVQCASEGAAADTEALELHASIGATRVRLELRGAFRLPEDADSAAGLERLRERFAMLYQKQGQLTWEQASGGAPNARIIADLPYESADGSHR